MNKSGRADVKRLNRQEEAVVKEARKYFQNALKSTGATCEVCCLADNSSLEVINDFEVLDGICYINTKYH